MENFKSTIDKNTKVGVLNGGLSSEREVSLRSGKNCYDALKRLGYKNTILIDVQKDIGSVLAKEQIDIAFLALHGTYGEDGCIQGLLEILDIPYTGSGVLASALAMNKSASKSIFKAHGIPVLPSVSYSTTEVHNGIKRKLKGIKLRYPVMVKPMSDGSSVGMTKVNEENNLYDAVMVAGKYKDGILIEEFLKGKQITIGVLDINKETVATPILELRTKTEWYDYTAKYTEGLTEFILPAEIDEETTKLAQEYAIKAHKSLGCRGVSRPDFIIAEDNTPYLLEINTLPGMTNLSDLPAQAKVMGINYDTLVDILLHSSLL
ncbi:MAG: D-alanine--D-alanine ligase [Cyanobacteriota bacterium]